MTVCFPAHQLPFYDYYRRLFNLREIHLSKGTSRDDASTSSPSDSSGSVVYHIFTPPKAGEKFLKRYYCYEDSKEWHKIVGHGMRKRKNETLKALFNGCSEDISEETNLPDESATHDNVIYPRKLYVLGLFVQNDLKTFSVTTWRITLFLVRRNPKRRTFYKTFFVTIILLQSEMKSFRINT